MLRQDYFLPTQVKQIQANDFFAEDHFPAKTACGGFLPKILDWAANFSLMDVDREIQLIKLRIHNQWENGLRYQFCTLSATPFTFVGIPVRF